MSAITTVTAASFLDRIGVDTHIPYTDGGYANLSNVQADLNFLGVKQLRDGISDGEKGSASLASYIQLAKAGEKFTFVVGGGTSTNASIQYTLGKIAQLAAAVPGSVKAVEGPNEINNQALTFNGVGGLQGAVALQQYLYQAVKSTPALAGVAVDYFTGYDTTGFAAGPDPSTTAGLADYDSQHPYPQGGQAPAHWVDPATALGNEPGPKGKFVYTETGYTTNLSDSNGVNATVQGKYTLDLLMDAAKNGASGTYLYQLMDAYKPGSPQGDDGYGLFDENNKPKLAATGIHNLAAILADTGATASSFTATALDYSVSGLPSTGNSLEISKSDGTTDIVVWAEPQLWNQSTKSEVAASAATATVNLGAAHQVSVYDPLLGTAPIATYASTSSVQLQVIDHPLIVQVGAAVTGPATSSGPTTSPGPTTGNGNSSTGAASTSPTIGSGPNKLVLAISEDAYQGDAQYTVSVDGQQVAGTLTAGASHAAGAADTVTLYGDWGAGQHTVGVNFLNDAYGGTSSTDRNLYVNGATYDGATVTNSAKTLLSAGTQSFNFSGAAVTGPTTSPGPTSPSGPTSSPGPTTPSGPTTSPGSTTGNGTSSTGTASTSPTIGSGLDKLVLAISEDAYQGDAQYTVSVDGQKVAGTLTAGASHAAGAADTVTLYGDWGAGQHTVGVNFLNDAYGGTSSTDRNLYVNGATYDGATVTNSAKTLLSAGTQSFTFSDVTPTSTGGQNQSIGSGKDQLQLAIGEDAWQGDAQYTVSVDGQQVGGTLTAHGAQGAKQADLVDVYGNWGAGNHQVIVNFLNDAYGGTSSTDRNLYVDGITYDGKVNTTGTTALLSAGPKTFSFHS